MRRFVGPNLGVLQKKKRSSLKLGRFFCSNLSDLKKEKVFTKIEKVVLFISYFSVGLQEKGGLHCPKNMKLPKILMQNCPKCMKLLEILMQNCPKNMILPKILTRDRHLKTKWGGQCPPAPPIS